MEDELKKISVVQQRRKHLHKARVITGRSIRISDLKLRRLGVNLGPEHDALILRRIVRK